MKELQCADNSTERLEKIFEKYANMVLRLALSQTRNQTYADDVLGEVFLRLVKSIGKLNEEEHIKAWLIRVTINCSKTYMKKCSRDNIPLSRDIPVFIKPEFGEVYAAVLSLQYKYRTVIHLFYYEDLTIKDISMLLGQGESATKMQLKRAKAVLKVLLGDDFV